MTSESKIEIKLQFPYVVQAQYEHRTAADTQLHYHCAYEQRFLLPLMWLNCLCHNLMTPTGHEGGKKALKIKRDIVDVTIYFFMTFLVKKKNHM